MNLRPCFGQAASKKMQFIGDSNKIQCYQKLTKIFDFSEK